ncbi:Sec34-like family-domain-containing protein [Apodospora peruviana]|uniref:Conserved oligomeric Golgi complex subunit 3 n=1 Tax=Apodospora peruviana TaxID=516989 RepID=A0AAE0M887_9PEZI|nr:Sec34-like family-domain-containing protein [Apodospora peruviana]
MYEDSWYSFVPEIQQRRGPSAVSSTQAAGPGHRRKESLLQQPNCAGDHADAANPLPALFEDREDTNAPPQALVIQRAKSYSDFCDIVTPRLVSQSSKKLRKQRRRQNHSTQWEALALSIPETGLVEAVEDGLQPDVLKEELLKASQQEYLLYHDQLEMTERHLGTLVDDANSALRMLESLCQSFRAVEDQTTSFQSQCDDLLTEQKRLEELADEIGTDLYYYGYLDNVIRRLNAPGAGRLVDDEVFGEVLANLDSCIAFMTKNNLYRDAESYLTRYQSLLTKALHLLEVGFTNRLEKVSSEISRQIAATQSESARHALAYGRFEEILMDSYSLIPNIQIVIMSAYDQYGQPKAGLNSDIYTNTANNLFHAFLDIRDRDLKPIVQHELDAFKQDLKDTSLETALRNFVKQCFERSYIEAALFRKIFSIEPHYSPEARSAFAALKSHQRSLVTGTNIAPIATNLQSTLQARDLGTVCHVIGWITSEYLLVDYDEDESPFAAHCRELASRILAEHLWTFTDAFFEAEIARSISRAVVKPEELKIGPMVGGNATSNAFPPVKRAVELLGMFDQSMPKERCQRNSPVVFKIVKESMAALHRADTRIRSSKNGTDSDLFMIKNLLILKNELLSLEIGDIRSSQVAGMGLQHFGQIWDTISSSSPLNLVGSILTSFTSYIPGSSLWSRSGTPTPRAATPSAQIDNTQHDAGEQLDGLLRQSIYAFTRRWATTINEARNPQSNKLGEKNLAKIERELDEMLERVFTTQPEVVAKLKEAIQIEAQAQSEAARESQKGGSRITRV